MENDKAASCQKLVDRYERAMAVLAVQEGLASVYRGEGEPARTVIERIRKRVRGSG
jgi:hypothetical protein